MAALTNTTGQSAACASQTVTPSGAQCTSCSSTRGSSPGSNPREASALISRVQTQVGTLQAALDRALAGPPLRRGVQRRAGFTRFSMQARHTNLAQRIAAPSQRIDDLQHTLAIVAQRKYV